MLARDLSALQEIARLFPDQKDALDPVIAEITKLKAQPRGDTQGTQFLHGSMTATSMSFGDEHPRAPGSSFVNNLSRVDSQPASFMDDIHAGDGVPPSDHFGACHSGDLAPLEVSPPDQALPDFEQAAIDAYEQKVPLNAPRLVLRGRGLLKQEFDLRNIGRGGFWDLGRDIDVTIRLPQNARTVSKRHLEIHRSGDQFFILDPGSTNGTFLNEQRIAVGTKIMLSDGMEVGLKPWFQLTFHAPRV